MVAVRQGDLAGQAMAHQHLGWLRFLLGDMVGLSSAYVLHSQGRIPEATAQPGMRCSTIPPETGKEWPMLFMQSAGTLSSFETISI